jgi:hypothetical protein
MDSTFSIWRSWPHFTSQTLYQVGGVRTARPLARLPPGARVIYAWYHGMPQPSLKLSWLHSTSFVLGWFVVCAAGHLLFDGLHEGAFCLWGEIQRFRVGMMFNWLRKFFGKATFPSRQINTRTMLPENWQRCLSCSRRILRGGVHEVETMIMATRLATHSGGCGPLVHVP